MLNIKNKDDCNHSCNSSSSNSSSDSSIKHDLLTNNVNISQSIGNQITNVHDKQNDIVIGHCYICSVKYDDYSNQIRCPTCRMLVLICPECVASFESHPISTEEEDKSQQTGYDDKYVKIYYFVKQYFVFLISL